MRSLRNILLFLLLPVIPARADLPADPAEYLKWEQKMLDAIELRRNEPRDTGIPKLGEYVHKLSFPWNREKGERKVYFAARSALISIPGHAVYFGDKIRRDRELRKAGRSDEIEGSRAWDFETLAQLPSAETVRVLGSFLDDEEGRIPADEIRKNPRRDMVPLEANSLVAARSLATLGIVNPPLRKKPDSMGYDDIHPWRLWFAQVQAGNRSFRFEGDPVEYTLSGPVGVGREETPAVRPKPMPGAVAVPEVKAPERTVPRVQLLIASALLGAALWFAFRKNPNRTPRA